MSWAERFAARGSALCIGLDPDSARIPEGLDVLAFLREVVDLTAEHAACFKPNVAFFERLGPGGLADLARLIADVRARGLPVIADAKRGDIGSTAEAYAAAYFGGPFGVDALTVNPFLGLDTLEPFRAAAAAHDAGVFIVLRTSNPGAATFQGPAEAALVEAISSDPAYGAVVGATDPTTGGRLRAALPDTLFLVPGFGAQGGDDVAPFFVRGGGAIVNSSRGILYAGERQPEWRDAVRSAAQAAHATIERARSG
ncbi:MAG: orotidine-5'-phosphate decarboxylase [Planctomycetota bacterium]